MKRLMPMYSNYLNHWLGGNEMIDAYVFKLLLYMVSDVCILFL